MSKLWEQRKRRRRGRPPLDPTGAKSVEIRVRLTKKQCAQLDDLAVAFGSRGRKLDRAQVVRKALDVLKNAYTYMKMVQHVMMDAVSEAGCTKKPCAVCDAMRDYL